MMKKILILTLLAVLTLASAGCITNNPNDSRIPQSRPASWEHSGPAGFGGPGFGGR